MRLSLGTGLDGWRRPAGRAGLAAPGLPLAAPALLAAPRISGTGRIGAALRLDPGRWSGAPAPSLSAQWQRGDADIPGAEGPSYVPRPTDDGAALRVRVTARNSLGQATAASAAVAVSYAPPAAAGRLPDLAVAQNSGVHMVNASLDFTGQGLTFAVSGPGVTVDPATGALAVASAALVAGLDVVVTARNSGGVAESRFRLTVAGMTAEPEPEPEPEPETPPAVAAAIPDQLLTLGTSGRVPLAGAFSGSAPVFSVSGGGAAIEAAAGGAAAGSAAGGAAGAILLPADRLLSEEPVVVTARNAAGAATLGFRLSVAAAPRRPAAPVVLGALPAVLLDQGSGEGTLSSQAGFAGEDLVFALAAAPAGVRIESGSGLVRIARAAPVAGTVTVRAENAAGAAEQSFAVTVRSTLSDFTASGSLADVAPLYYASPSWTQQPEGFARLVPAAAGRVHSAWRKAQGDGRYRCLARWNAAATDPAGARPFSFNARLGQTKPNWSGLKVDVVQPSAGVRTLEIGQYSGLDTKAAVLATAIVSWQWNSWYWVEIELDGTSVRARLYAEAAAAPAWQVSATTSHVAPGSFGPGGFPLPTESPSIDIRRLEFLPLIQGFESVPPAASDADWSLGQFTESK